MSESNIQMSATELINKVYAMLDYKVKNYEQRRAIVQQIQDLYGDEIQARYEFYANSDLSRHDNYQQYKLITKLMDTLSDYLLMSDDVKKNRITIQKNN